MKTTNFYYLLSLFFLLSCGQTGNGNSENEYYYSTEIDTSYNDSSDRTKITDIERKIYYKVSDDFVKSLTFSRNLINTTANEFTISRVNLRDLDNIKTDILEFDNISEIKSLFQKIDSLDVGESLKERKKTKHYEIFIREGRISIKQFSDKFNFGLDMYLNNKEYKGIKFAFEKYLLETEQD